MNDLIVIVNWRPSDSETYIHNLLRVPSTGLFIQSRVTRMTTSMRFFLIRNSARAWTSVILAGKRYSCRHSTTSLTENVVMAETSHQMLEVLSFCDWERAEPPVIHTDEARTWIGEKAQSQISTCSRSCPRIWRSLKTFNEFVFNFVTTVSICVYSSCLQGKNRFSPKITIAKVFQVFFLTISSPISWNIDNLP